VVHAFAHALSSRWYRWNELNGTKWSAPDLAKAKQLVKESGTAGQKVTVYSSQGLDATTHHVAFDELAQASPSTRVVRGARFVDNGRIVTSAGISAGIDASLHVVAKLLGHAVAAETAGYMEYDWNTPNNEPKQTSRSSH